MESREFFNIAVKRGAAIVQIAVTRPVVINTTRTHPGTSPRSSFNRARNESCKVVSLCRSASSAVKILSITVFMSFSFYDRGWNAWFVLDSWFVPCDWFVLNSWFVPCDWFFMSWFVLILGLFLMLGLLLMIGLL
jgi:hypothetical protein